MNLFHLGKGKVTTLHELFLEQLRDLYSAETQLTKALPQMKEDAALIAAAQRVEHYEMAGYGTVRTYASLMGHKDAEAALQRTLDEEGACNEKLTKAAGTLNLKVPLGHKKGEIPAKK